MQLRNKQVTLFNLKLFVLDVITIEKTGEYFRLLYDVKGRFAVHRITEEEAQVCKECVKKALHES